MNKEIDKNKLSIAAKDTNNSKVVINKQNNLENIKKSKYGSPNKKYTIFTKRIIRINSFSSSHNNKNYSLGAKALKKKYLNSRLNMENKKSNINNLFHKNNKCSSSISKGKKNNINTSKISKNNSKNAINNERSPFQKDLTKKYKRNSNIFNISLDSLNKTKLANKIYNPNSMVPNFNNFQQDEMGLNHKKMKKNNQNQNLSKSPLENNITNPGINLGLINLNYNGPKNNFNKINNNELSRSSKTTKNKIPNFISNDNLNLNQSMTSMMNKNMNNMNNMNNINNRNYFIQQNARNSHMNQGYINNNNHINMINNNMNNKDFANPGFINNIGPNNKKN